MDFLGELRLQDTFQEQIVLKSTEIDMEKLCMKFLALNEDSDSPSLDFSRFRETCAGGHQRAVPP